MSQYGEPWSRSPGTTEFVSHLPEPSNQQPIGMIFLRDPRWRPGEVELINRIIACVNACAGMSDPAAAIKQAQEFTGMVARWEAGLPPDIRRAAQALLKTLGPA